MARRLTRGLARRPATVARRLGLEECLMARRLARRLVCLMPRMKVWVGGQKTREKGRGPVP